MFGLYISSISIWEHTFIPDDNFATLLDSSISRIGTKSSINASWLEYMVAYVSTSFNVTDRRFTLDWSNSISDTSSSVDRQPARLTGSTGEEANEGVMKRFVDGACRSG